MLLSQPSVSPDIQTNGHGHGHTDVNTHSPACVCGKFTLSLNDSYNYPVAHLMQGQTQRLL